MPSTEAEVLEMEFDALDRAAFERATMGRQVAVPEKGKGQRFPVGDQIKPDRRFAVVTDEVDDRGAGRQIDPP